MIHHLLLKTWQIRSLKFSTFFGLGVVMCMGVTAGAYILTLFAMKHRERVLDLILISTLCKAPSWSEWFYNKVMSNLLYFYGMCGVVEEFLLQRYFSKEVRGNIDIPESDIAQACRRPLLIQFRMFFEGYAIKGTSLLNKKLLPGTIQVRPSMIKVEKDPNLSNFITFNSLEVVSRRYFVSWILFVFDTEVHSFLLLNHAISWELMIPLKSSRKMTLQSSIFAKKTQGME